MKKRSPLLLRLQVRETTGSFRITWPVPSGIYTRPARFRMKQLSQSTYMHVHNIHAGFNGQFAHFCQSNLVQWPSQIQTILPCNAFDYVLFPFFIIYWCSKIYRLTKCPKFLQCLKLEPCETQPRHIL